MAKQEKNAKNSVTKPSAGKLLKPKKIGRFLRRNWWKVLIVVLVIVGLSLFTKEYLDTKQQLKDLQNPKANGQTQLQEIVGQVSKVTELPTDETPTLATVNDKTKLESQAFFKNAQNGDRVLIYAQAKRAVLYRPSTNKVIEITTVNFDSSAKQPAATPAQ